MLGIGNLIAAFLSFYFNRGMLEKAELNN